MQEPHLRPQFPFGLVDRLLQPLRRLPVRDIGEPLGELVPLLAAEGVPGELAAGLFRDRPEATVADLLHRDPDHPKLRHQPRLKQPQQPRQQLPPRQVARGAEDDYRLRRNVHETSLASADTIKRLIRRLWADYPPCN